MSKKEKEKKEAKESKEAKDAKESKVEKTVEETTEKAQESPESVDAEVVDVVVEESKPSETEEQLLRLKAEYDNFRKRSIKEKSDIKDEALRKTALAFLPVYDNLDRALKQTTQDETFKKGVEMTMMQLKTILSDLGLEKIPALGELFNPNLHEALTHAEDENWGENTITEVFMDGFTYNGKVIRFAQVKVVN